MPMRLLFLLIMLILSVWRCTPAPDTSPAPGESVLGEYVQLSLSSTDLNETLDFYRRLGFSILEQHPGEAIPWALISDGRLIAMISQNDFPSPGITYFGKGLDDRLTRLRTTGFNFQVLSRGEGRPMTVILISPGGLGITLIDMSSRYLPKATKSNSFRFGKFAYLAVAGTDSNASMDFWEKAGFSKTGRLQDPFPATVLSDGLLEIALGSSTDVPQPIVIYQVQDLNAILPMLAREQISMQPFHIGGKTGINSLILRSPDEQEIIITQIP